MVYQLVIKFSSFKPKRDFLEVKEDIRMKRIFHLFPRKKRSQRVEIYKTMNGFLLPEDTPEWLIAHMRDMKGSKPKKIAEKTLTKSDVKKGEGRLLIPFSKLIDSNFLNSRELSIMEEDVRTLEKMNGIGTVIIDQRSRKWGANLRRWDMRKQDSGKVTMNYVLVSGWNQLVEANEFKENDSITIWSFRSRGVLCFAIAP